MKGLISVGKSPLKWSRECPSTVTLADRLGCTHSERISKKFTSSRTASLQDGNPDPFLIFYENKPNIWFFVLFYPLNSSIWHENIISDLNSSNFMQKAAPTVQAWRDWIWGVSNSWKEFKKTLTKNSVDFYLLGTNLICFENQVFFRSLTTSCNTLKRRQRQLEALKRRLSAFFFCQT